MVGLLAAILAIGSVGPFDPDDEVPAAAVKDRKSLVDAIKAASRCGETGHPSAADFDAATIGWGRKAAHLYILPLVLEDALRRYDAAHPDAPLGGPPLDFHRV